MTGGNPYAALFELLTRRAAMGMDAARERQPDMPAKLEAPEPTGLDEALGLPPKPTPEEEDGRWITLMRKTEPAQMDGRELLRALGIHR